jgi:hypothetical protein
VVGVGVGVVVGVGVIVVVGAGVVPVMVFLKHCLYYRYIVIP